MSVRAASISLRRTSHPATASLSEVSILFISKPSSDEAKFLSGEECLNILLGISDRDLCSLFLPVVFTGILPRGGVSSGGGGTGRFVFGGLIGVARLLWLMLLGPAICES